MSSTSPCSGGGGVSVLFLGAEKTQPAKRMDDPADIEDTIAKILLPTHIIEVLRPDNYREKAGEAQYIPADASAFFTRGHKV
jgi:hypothetical protein